jgi:hypothetical protein
MKIIIILFVSIFYLNAESMYQGLCVDTFRFNRYNNYLYISYSGKNYITTIPYDSAIYDELINNYNKFEYEKNTDLCYLQNLSKNYGMTNEQFNFLSALTGLLTSILLVFIIFLKV